MEDFFPSPPPLPSFAIRGHTKQTLLLSLSLFFVAASYSYLTVLAPSFLLKRLDSDLIQTNAMFLIMIMLSLGVRLPAGMIGDFLLGHKAIMVLGHVLLALGMATLCIPDNRLLWLSVVVTGIGNGFHVPGAYARLGTLYLGKRHHLDAGISFGYLGLVTGSLLGSALGWLLLHLHVSNTMSILAPLLLALGGLPFTLAIRNFKLERLPSLKASFKPTSLIYLFTVLLVMLFCHFGYEILYSAQSNIVRSDPSYFSQSTVIQYVHNLGFYIFAPPALILFAVLWSFVRINRLLKLLIGQLLVLLGGILFLVGRSHLPTYQTMASALVLLVIITAGDSLTLTTNLSIIVRKAPPRLLGSMIGLLCSIPFFLSIAFQRLSFLSLGEFVSPLNTSVAVLVSGLLFSLVLIGVAYKIDREGLKD